MHTKTIPFQALTDNGAYVGQAEEFNTEQFRTMMKGELWRYSRRQLANVIQVSGDEKFSSMIVMLKLMEMHMHEKLASIEACVLEDKCENERERARTNDRLDEVLTILRALPQSSVQRGDRGGAEGNDWSGGVGKLKKPEEAPPPHACRHKCWCTSTVKPRWRCPEKYGRFGARHGLDMGLNMGLHMGRTWDSTAPPRRWEHKLSCRAPRCVSPTR